MIYTPLLVCGTVLYFFHLWKTIIESDVNSGWFLLAIPVYIIMIFGIGIIIGTVLFLIIKNCLVPEQYIIVEDEVKLRKNEEISDGTKKHRFKYFLRLMGIFISLLLYYIIPFLLCLILYFVILRWTNMFANIYSKLFIGLFIICIYNKYTVFSLAKCIAVWEPNISPLKCVSKAIKLMYKNKEYKKLINYYSPYKDFVNIVYYENILNENKE